VLGTADGDPDIEATGALYALYFFALEHAAERGLTRMDFGHGAPVLSAGVLRHKSWWGARLVDDDAMPTCLAVRWERANDRVRSFLARHPLIFYDRDGLSAVTALDGGATVPPNRVDRLRRSVALPGLRRLFVMGQAGRETAYLGSAADAVSPDDGCRLVVCRDADVWAMLRR
jgi:hypothetical protein